MSIRTIRLKQVMAEIKEISKQGFWDGESFTENPLIKLYEEKWKLEREIRKEEDDMRATKQLEYERRKQILQDTCKSSEEYQREIIKLCKELKI